MTILLWELALAPVNGTSSRWHNKIVIPTGAQRSGGTCCFFPSPGSVVADKGKTTAPQELIWTSVTLSRPYGTQFRAVVQTLKAHPVVG